MQARVATPDDVPALSAALARAFFDDPVAEYALPSRRRRQAQLERFYVQRLRTLIPDELVFCDAGRTGGALWAAPDRWRTSLAEILRTRAFSHRTLHFLVGAHRVEAAHPEVPHYYLAVLGVSPDAQGRGLGSTVLRPMLDRCDAEGVPAYLESSKERNVGFYERHGFRVTGETTLPRGGPRMWFMWREPRG